MTILLFLASVGFGLGGAVGLLANAFWLQGRFDELQLRGTPLEYLPAQRLHLPSTAGWLFTACHRKIADPRITRATMRARACFLLALIAAAVYVSLLAPGPTDW
ncbi:hypothetical protein ASD79_02270 [Caulobacter sp. Root655]|uniref:hypothetical protein n=1 Tax=Caulobacter sp. Root655 TaxID=1736578 RepID=UPI0006F36EEB|nr:hypothetical protein [Caulobacter sp. Root655]KRA66128.1 hypothetical protein ASD79_02270 [Caulobacter sp. Root655]